MKTMSEAKNSQSSLRASIFGLAAAAFLAACGTQPAVGIPGAPEEGGNPEASATYLRNVSYECGEESGKIVVVGEGLNRAGYSLELIPQDEGGGERTRSLLGKASAVPVSGLSMSVASRTVEITGGVAAGNYILRLSRDDGSEAPQEIEFYLPTYEQACGASVAPVITTVQRTCTNDGSRVFTLRGHKFAGESEYLSNGILWIVSDAGDRMLYLDDLRFGLWIATGDLIVVPENEAIGMTYFFLQVGGKSSNWVLKDLPGDASQDCSGPSADTAIEVESVSFGCLEPGLMTFQATGSGFESLAGRRDDLVMVIDIKALEIGQPVFFLVADFSFNGELSDDSFSFDFTYSDVPGDRMEYETVTYFMNLQGISGPVSVTHPDFVAYCGTPPAR